MTTIVPIVEGSGEVEALPVLLRQLGAWINPHVVTDIQRPIPVKRNRFLKYEDGEDFVRILQLAALKSGDAGWILIMLDADDDCPFEIGRTVLEQARRIVAHRRISVVLPNREYEAWFIAAAESLEGHRGFSAAGGAITTPEAIRGAKEWMSVRMASGKYRETTDQAAFSAIMSLPQAWKNSRSFRKLCSEWSQNVLMWSSGESTTP